MYKYIAGFIAGVIISGLTFIPILKTAQQSSLEQGRNTGMIGGLMYSVQKLESEFGALSTPGEHKALYNVKTSSVVAIEINGVKTVRVIP